MTDSPQVRFAVVSEPAAAGFARGAARRTLLGWRLPSLVDDVVLTVSELITNAVRHGRAPVWLTLRLRPELLHVEVQDAEPAMTEPETGRDEGGRGLDIVRAVATSTGIHEIPEDGKYVYATFALPPDHLR